MPFCEIFALDIVHKRSKSPLAVPLNPLQTRVKSVFYRNLLIYKDFFQG